MKIGLVTDSASDISFEFANKHNIKIAPLHISFDGEEYREDESFDFDTYYQNFENRDLFKVNTAQPSPGEFLEKYQELVDEGHDYIICATISSGLSGTYNSAVMASRQVMEDHDIQVAVVDSKSASVSVVYLIELALKMIDDHAEPEEIVAAMEKRAQKVETYLVLPTLKYLRAGGRVSMPKFLLGRLFGLKPITYVEKTEGKNEAIATTRNMENGLQKIYNFTTDKGTKFANHYSITHTNDEELAKKMVAIIRANQPDVEIRITRARSSISAHAGPGAVALISLFD